MDYYHKVCGNVFWSFRRIKRGDPCPKCKKPFAAVNTFSCECSTIHTYFTDDSREIGELLDCPITGARVKVLNKSLITNWFAIWGSLGARTLPLLVKVILVIVGLALLCAGISIIESFTTYLVNQSVKGFTAMTDAIDSLLTGLIEALPTLGQMTLALLGLLALHRLIHAVSVQQADAFSQAYPRVVGNLSHPWSQPNLSQPAQTSPQVPNYANVIAALNLGQRTVRRQQFTIGGLLIAAAIVLLICYLSIDTVEEAQQAFKQVAWIGAPTILICAVLFYSSIFFFKLYQKGKPVAVYRVGGFLALLLGVATVCTVTLLPPFLEEGSLSEYDIVIGLTINIIGDVFINLYEASIEKFWHSWFGKS